MQGSSAPINIPIMSRLPSLKDDEAEDAKKPFVPPHLVDENVSCAVCNYCNCCIVTPIACCAALHTYRPCFTACNLCVIRNFFVSVLFGCAETPCHGVAFGCVMLTSIACHTDCLNCKCIQTGTAVSQFTCCCCSVRALDCQCCIWVTYALLQADLHVCCAETQ
jgi:hypothetical protein